MSTKAIKKRRKRGCRGRRRRPRLIFYSPKIIQRTPKAPFIYLVHEKKIGGRRILYDFQNHEENAKNGNLMESCMKLEKALTHNGNADLSGFDLFHEFPSVAKMVKDEKITVIEQFAAAKARKGKFI